MISLSEIKDLAVVAQLLGAIAMGFVVLWAKVNFTPRADHTSAQAEVDKRITIVEKSVAECARRDQLSALTAQLSELQADGREARTRLAALNDRLDEQLSHIRDAVTRIEDHLLSRKL